MFYFILNSFLFFYSDFVAILYLINFPRPIISFLFTFYIFNKKCIKYFMSSLKIQEHSIALETAINRQNI